VDINIIASSCTELNNNHIFSLLKNRDKTKNHIIIAPDRSQFSLEQRLFEETGEKCFFDINVISLSRLAKSVIKGNKKNILTKQSGIALIKKILKENKDKLFAFNKATSFMGFASSLFETICFYKSCNVKPNEVFVDNSNSLANLKQKDIKLVYTEYENYLKTDYTDSFNQLQLFADTINKDTFKNTIFYFVEFDDFTRLMYNIILKMSKFSDGIYIACSYGKNNNNANIFNNKVYYDLIDLYKSENLDYKINNVTLFEDKTKNHLATNLLAYSPSKLDLTDSNIFLKEFKSVEDEIKYTINDVYSKLLLYKNDLSEFAIVVPNLNEYKVQLVSLLKKYSINYYIDESQKLIDHSLIRLLFGIVNIILGDYRLHDFSAVLKSPLLNLNIVEVGIYDNYLHRIGAISDMCLKCQTTNEGIAELISTILQIREKSKNVETISDCIEVVCDIWSYITNNLEDYLSQLSSVERRIVDQVANKFDNINKDIKSVFQKELVSSFADFIEIYNEYFESTNISMPPITSNTLFVADFNNSYISKYNYLYILGNNDSKLPSMKLDNGILTDDELLRLPNAKKLSPTIAMLNARKTLKLFDMIFKFNKELHLSYSNNCMEGKLYPNKLIESIKTIGNIQSIANYSDLLDVINFNYENVNCDNVIFNNLAPKVAEENLINYLANWDVYNNNINFRQVCSTLYNLLGEKTKSLISNINTTITVPNLKNFDFFESGNSSVSEIETFNNCPYLHYVRYGLELKDNKDTRLKPNDIGNIIHETLSVVVRDIYSNREDIDFICDKAEKTLTSLLKKDKYKDIVENLNNAYEIKALYKEIKRVVIAVTNEIKSSNFVPKYFEYYFDKTININGVNLKGYIDRIDKNNNDGFIIIDYKTGNNQFKNYNDVYSGKKLQLLVYAKAFENISNLKSKGVFYLPISNGFGESDMYRFNGVLLKTEDNIVDLDRGLAVENHKSNIISLQTTSKGKIRDCAYYKNMCISREDFDYLLDFAMKQVRVSIDKIKKGEINPYPLVEKQKSVCEYCQYKAICNYNNDNPHDVINVENIAKLKELEDGGV